MATRTGLAGGRARQATPCTVKRACLLAPFRPDSLIILQCWRCSSSRRSVGQWGGRAMCRSLGRSGDWRSSPKTRTPRRFCRCGSRGRPGLRGDPATPSGAHAALELRRRSAPERRPGCRRVSPLARVAPPRGRCASERPALARICTSGRGSHHQDVDRRRARHPAGGRGRPGEPPCGGASRLEGDHELLRDLRLRRPRGQRLAALALGGQHPPVLAHRLSAGRAPAPCAHERVGSHGQAIPWRAPPLCPRHGHAPARGPAGRTRQSSAGSLVTNLTPAMPLGPGT